MDVKETKKQLNDVKRDKIKLADSESRLEGIRKIIREYQAVECQLDFKVFYYKRKLQGKFPEDSTDIKQKIN
jgi:hypothetical protein